MKPTAVITGGAQGIGRCIVQTLLEQGSAVIAVDNDETAGREISREYKTNGDFSFVKCDVSDERSVKQCMQYAGRRFKGLDLLVNNAGIMKEKNIQELGLAEWNRVISVNLTGTFLCAKYAVPLLKQKKGSIINIASTRALMSEKNTESYSASKGGIIALTHSLAISLGPAIRVNSISPGWIDVSMWQKKSRRHATAFTGTDHRQHPAGRIGKPEDVARAVLFLADHKNGFLTGANVIIDGGMTRKMIYL
ncbi:MAG: SDR family oxidoreductase [Elusimicrobia bacterium]|nr:SDR family oxidoreductase [Elusimicrobiota bacterium]MBD3411911.1 SDR family oxidoreductase [Elusimicrobiota bacterium]